MRATSARPAGADNFLKWRRAIDEADPVPLTGTVVRAAGLVLEAALPRVAVGTACEIRATDGALVMAEVVGFFGQTALRIRADQRLERQSSRFELPLLHQPDTAIEQDFIGTRYTKRRGERPGREQEQ